MKSYLRRVSSISAIAVPLVFMAILIQSSYLTASPADAKKKPIFEQPVDLDVSPAHGKKIASFDELISHNAGQMLNDGRQIFRFDTFGDQEFWGGQLQLHRTIAGAGNGGIGPGLSPNQALQLGLKVDVNALPEKVENQLLHGRVDLNDPATTLALLKLNAVVGITGFFDNAGRLTSVGIQCALCHSTVDNSFAFGIGRRLDGWANRDLNVGAIIAFAPNMQPFIDLLSVVIPTIDAATVRAVLNSWGPGKFDAELLLDGKAVNPITGKSAATMLPNAFGLAGFNQHTWTGAWGTVSYWNAFVANIEMRGKGVFFDPRLDNAAKFPIAAAFPELFGHIQRDPDSDLITSKLPALHFYQLAIPAPKPRPGMHFDADAAARGEVIFITKAGCGGCHVKPLWTEPGWNLHTPEEIQIESFQADRAPDNKYKTMNLAGIFIRELGIFMKAENKGRFYHDGRFSTLLDVVDSYTDRFNLGLTQPEKLDLVEYLKSL